eukprot:TRINITY_DN75_c0_g1_i9.p1 TRINITY_DN75_c0_g1~~TRINITY_DN75_c0_g1_i9.p1  ORF type:complete len:194 (+),score=28.93 TRINITY_DN75_c0_g1_i9:139-720(+)
MLFLLFTLFTCTLAKPTVTIQTSAGDIAIELDEVNAPISVANFLKYVDDGFYEGTIFHRVIKDFMIQGGGHTADLTKKGTRAPIKNEWKNGLKNTLGTLAMARLGGRPDSATSQFFINVKDNPFLDTPSDGAAYAVFGKVIDGFDVLRRIEIVSTSRRGGMGDVPVIPVVIQKIIRTSTEEVAPPPPPRQVDL